MPKKEAVDFFFLNPCFNLINYRKFRVNKLNESHTPSILAEKIPRHYIIVADKNTDIRHYKTWF